MNNKNIFNFLNIQKEIASNLIFSIKWMKFEKKIDRFKDMFFFGPTI